jgi:hypothetical protein
MRFLACLADPVPQDGGDRAFHMDPGTPATSPARSPAERGAADPFAPWRLAWHLVCGSSTARAAVRARPSQEPPGSDQPMVRDTRLPGWRSRRPSSSSSSSARCTSAVLALHCRISSSTRSGSGYSGSNSTVGRS